MGHKKAHGFPFASRGPFKMLSEAEQFPFPPLVLQPSPSMNSPSRFGAAVFCCAANLCPLPLTAQLAPASADATSKKTDEEALRLSVFEVSSSNDIGYQS